MLLKLIRLLFLVLFSTLFLIACGQVAPEPNASEEQAPDAFEAPNDLDSAPTAEVDILPRVTITPEPIIESVPVDEAYPIAPATPIPQDGYPAPVIPTHNPYPVVEGNVWIVFPVGEQCADAANGRYEDLTAAVAGLTAAGITVTDSEITELLVCSACGCPTSAHYRVEIDGTQLSTALSLDWTVESAE
ncbi:MAG: hypothetical protein GY943_17110 [Chloroflexi bacterium]|nr:hypothetical protein [Chloroflexota bacterium]